MFFVIKTKTEKRAILLSSTQKFDWSIKELYAAHKGWLLLHFKIFPYYKNDEPKASVGAGSDASGDAIQYRTASTYRF